MIDEMRASAGYAALKNSTRLLLEFVAAEVERQSGGAVTVLDGQLEAVGPRGVYLSGLHELAFLGLIEVARLSGRSLICLSDRWR